MVESGWKALAGGISHRTAGDGLLTFLDGASRLERADASGKLPEEDAARREDERRLQRRSRDERRADAAAQALAPPTHSQIVAEQERTLAPGSRAAARQERNAQAASDRQERGQAFQKALQEAASQARDRQQLAVAAGADEPLSGPAARDTPDASDVTLRPGPSAPRPAVMTVHHPSDGIARGGSPLRPAQETDHRATSPSGAPAPLPMALSQSSPDSASVPVVRGPSMFTASAGPDLAADDAPVGPVRAAASVVGRPGGPSTTPNALASLSLDRAPATARIRTASATAPTEAAPRENDVNIERIVRVVQGQIDRHRSTTTIRLDPPELGMIRLRLDLRNEALSLRIEAQTDVAHRLLRSELDALRSSLDAAGIQLQQVELRPLSPAPTSGGEAWTPAEHRQGWQDSADSAQRESNGREQGGDATARPAPREETDSRGLVVALDDQPTALDRPAVADRSARASRVNVLA